MQASNRYSDIGDVYISNKNAVERNISLILLSADGFRYPANKYMDPRALCQEELRLRQPVSTSSESKGTLVIYQTWRKHSRPGPTHKGFSAIVHKKR